MKYVLNYTNPNQHILNSSVVQSFYRNNGFNSFFAILRIALVLILRAGFVLIQIGCVPTENSYDIILQNIVEFSVSASSYGVVGALLSFGNDSFKGIIGYSLWSASNLDLDNVILGFCAVIIGSAIITTLLSGRLHFVSYVVVAFVYGGFTQPIIIHWIWNINGWMNNVMLYNRKMIIKDHAGSLVVHMSAGLVGLIGTAILGRRLLRLKSIDDSSLGAESPGTTLIGYIFLITGFMAFSCPMQKTNLFHSSDYVHIIIINNLLALAGGSFATIILEFILWRNSVNYWVIIRCIQGCISGLIIVSASVDTASPPITFLVSLTGCTLIGATTKLIFKSSVEDYCNIIPIHLLSGLWATVLQPITEKLNNSMIKKEEIFLDISWQVICSVAVVIFLFIIYGYIFLMLWCCGFLRNKIEENCHARALKVSKNYEECIFNRLFVVNSSDVMLEPGPSGKMPDYVKQIENKISDDAKKNEFNAKLPKKVDNNGQNKTTTKGQHSQINRKNIPKTKNIYTLHSPMWRNDLNNENIRCSGDTSDFNGIYKLEDLICHGFVKLTDSKRSIPKKVKSNILRKKSHHKLSKSRKYVDFPRNKRLKKPWIHKTVERNFNCERNADLVNYDRRYNDGITTIKMPTFDPQSD